ncbi:GIY-YIG nuclease family protein [Gulbenkiania mobilis]|uniref:Endonuclease n=1 Tax=Gulbenkiania mobilis TaxID=397457 RepID=A0ABY2CZF7_GULMO|nr:putative endonuclease [Gulbenkiania mobilis]
MKPWYLYILECRGGRLYTGITTDVARRYAAHASGRGARFTRSHPPERLCLVLAFESRQAAAAAEYTIKQWSVARKRAWLADQTASGTLPCQGATLPADASV